MEVVVIFLLFALNGFLSMYEMAIVSCSKIRLEALASQGNRKAKDVLRLKDAPENVLSTIQIGITLIGIVLGAVGGLAIAEDLEPILKKIPYIEMYASDISLIIVIFFITYFSLIIGELVPKSAALSHPEKIAMALSPIVLILSKLFCPFVWLLSVSTRYINNLLGIDNHPKGRITEDELKYVLNKGAEDGVIDHRENKMINEVFRFSDKIAGDIMTHRHDITYLYVNQSKEDVLEIIRKKRYSHYLLCRESAEEVVGVIVVKDIISLWKDNVLFNLEKIVQTPLYIPNSMLANKVLELFKKNKSSFGVVVDEYGVIEGIITLYDLSECILGDVLEYGESGCEDVVLRSDNSYLVDGIMSLDDFWDKMDISFKGKSLCKTVGGLAMNILERLPKEGDKFEYNGFLFEVVDMDGTRTDKLLVKKL